jgi:hypothetical protein
MPSHASFVAMQRCDEHISAPVNQHATVQEAVFSMCPTLTSHNSAEKDHMKCFLRGPYEGL